MKIYGLIGKKLDHSFSPQYFKEKFKKEGISDTYYHLYPLSQIEDFTSLIQDNSEISGLNVTIPYKTQIIPFLDDISPAAKEIGAVNTIKFEPSQQGIRLIGYNTDYLGFIDSVKTLLKLKQFKALVLGTGGSSKAVIYGLKQLGIDFKLVSREPTNINQIGYSSLTKDLFSDFKIIINTTPVGMFPNVG